MHESAELYETLAGNGLREIAPYAVVMAYRVRFYMDMNAREAMHVIELRTTPQGHPAYRRVCQLMHRAIADVAGHHAIAAAMHFADHPKWTRTAAIGARDGGKRGAPPRLLIDDWNQSPALLILAALGLAAAAGSASASPSDDPGNYISFDEPLFALTNVRVIDGTGAPAGRGRRSSSATA
jgi:hypothetical protein